MKKNILIVGSIAGLLAISFAGYAIFAWRQPAYATATVARGSLSQEVLANGTVQAPTTVNLSFQNPGTLSSLKVSVGDDVKRGAILAEQDAIELRAKLAEAQANLATLRQGATPEDVAVSTAQVQNAKGTLDAATSNLKASLRNGLTAADDAVRTQADSIFINPDTNTPDLAILVPNQLLADALKADRVRVGDDLDSWRALIQQLTAASDLDAVAGKISTYVTDIGAFMGDAAAALNITTSTTNVAVWKANVAAGRSEVAAAIANVTAARSAFNSSALALTVAEKQLALKQAPPTADQIAASQAQVDLIRAQLSQAVLTAPADAVVADTHGSVGETTNPGMIMISLIPKSTLEIKLNVSEDNIVGIKVGQPARITLDAFPKDVTWTGTVESIDPAQTIVGGAIYYKTTIAFDAPDSRIRPGMTANVWIQTGIASSTLVVPASALQTDQTGTYVSVLDGGEITHQSVTTGLKSKDGMVEISGVSEGTRIILGSH